MKVFVPIVILYLIVSSIYCSIHIDFRGRPQITSPGYSRETNLIRNFMGLPSTMTTYEGVPPIYLLQVVIKMVIALILLLWYPKLNEKDQKEMDDNNMGMYINLHPINHGVTIGSSQ